MAPSTSLRRDVGGPILAFMIVMIAVLLAGGFAFVTIKHHLAVDRCTRRGGVTNDGGRTCILMPRPEHTS